MNDPFGPAIEAALSALTLERKVQVLTGRDFWSTWPLEEIGLRSMVVSDGPSGVRGAAWDEREPSLNLPSASSLSASWDAGIARRYGAVAAGEARRKGIDVVLGPTINLHRSPRGGRHFECFSEDPVLTGDLAASYVEGLQANGVGATPKHYIANDSETDRFTVDVRVDERPLRELYLLAFERAIVESRAWLVMSAYNSINGTTATENELLTTPLSTEWGFDGVVISDWTAVRSIESAKAGQDLVMPGPQGPWGDALVAAVRAGEVDEAVIDEKVRRLLRLAARVGALEGVEQTPLVDVEDGLAFTREAAAEGMVLLTNDGTLPLDVSTLRSVALIGNSAEHARTQGGGSATVVPEHVVSPIEGLRAALPAASITYALGAVSQTGIAGFPLETMSNPQTGELGARVAFRDAQGEELFVEDRRATELVWFGGDAPIAQTRSVEVTLRLTPERDDVVEIGFASVGHGRLWLDGELQLDALLEPEGDDLGAAFLSPPVAAVPVTLVAGKPIDVRFVLEVGGQDSALAGALSLNLGTQPAVVEPQALIDEAVAAARSADVAIVVVGTNSKVESEGFDRESLRLPGHQDALVSAVAAANARTIVVVNAGSPVIMPWRDEVAAVLIGWFGGEQFGHAIADVLTGAREPGGRLPTTWPAAEADVPVIDTVPTDGTLRYDEGIHIGYRAWLRSPAAPAYWFGHGLGYTSFTLDALDAEPHATVGSSIDLSVTVANTGHRAGKQVVQVYAERAESAIDRPVRWLVGHAVARLDSGESTVLSVSIPTRLLAHWAQGWQHELGTYTLRVGTTAVDLPLSVEVELRAAE